MFSEMFEEGMHKSSMIGVFLAILELARNYHIRAEQNEMFGEIWMLPSADADLIADFSEVDDYEHGAARQDA